ncbi:hypothetical protein D1AOALGA4SA_7540 [Olavius algarvensis Delta 1 endosymbiont]|nr:hypothetical protein D1AOALGA4SA_7540 [Olavius algarvensis Delta 1 endosymbiont]
MLDRFRGSRFWVQRFKFQYGRRPRVQANHRRNIEKANIEYRIMNVEGRRNVFCLFYKKTERSDSIIRHYLLVISPFLKFHTSGGLWPKKRPV